MLKTPLFAPMFSTLAALGAIHLAAIHFAWYWTYWWTDVVTHFLGGVFVGFAALWLVYFSPARHWADWAARLGLGEFTPGRALALAIVAGLVVGGLWEVFEFSTNMFVAENPFPDTWYDLWADLAGSLVAYIVSSFHIRRYTDKTI